jgi:hypothetical protein
VGTIEYLGIGFSGIPQIDEIAAVLKLDSFLRPHFGEELSVVGSLEVDL